MILVVVLYILHVPPTAFLKLCGHEAQCCRGSCVSTSDLPPLFLTALPTALDPSGHRLAMAIPGGLLVQQDQRILSWKFFPSGGYLHSVPSLHVLRHVIKEPGLLCRLSHLLYLP